MKRMKKIAALMLAVVIMCLSFITVYAEEFDQALHKKIYEMKDLCEEAFYAFGIARPYEIIPDPGSEKPNKLQTINSEIAVQVFDEAMGMIRIYEGEKPWPHPPYEGEINLETATQMYNKMYEALHTIIIDRVEVEELVALCEKENNDNGYYDEQLWNDFQVEIAQAKELLADESIVDTRVTTAFYELMYQYNLLCSCNKIYCDIDGDGTMTIMDATYIQRYLVGYETFNSSQVFVSPENYIDDISVMNATTIQKRCTETKEYYSRNLRILLEEIETSNPESEDFMFDSIKCNIIYYGNGASDIFWY